MWHGKNDLVMMIIFAVSSNNNGLTFNSPVNLSNDPVQSVAPQIAASGSNVSVVWSERLLITGIFDILSASSIDGGLTFNSSVNVSDTPPGTSEVPQIAIVGNNVYIVWQETITGY